MDRRSTRRRRAHSQKRPVWLVMTLTVVLIALIVVAVWLPSLLKQDPTQPTDPASNPTSSTPTGGAHPESMEELIIHSVTEQGEWMCVSTSYGDFSYPFAYSDLMVINTISEETYVAFAMCANIGSIEGVYNIWINQAIGTYAGVLTLEGKTYPVYVEFIAPRQDLDESALPSFYAAQETLNDVLRSWAEAGFYTVAA